MTQSLPKVDLNIIPAGGIVQDGVQKVLFVGQMIKNNTVDTVKNPPGTFTPAATGSLVTNIPDDETGNNALYGPRSIIAAMLAEGRKVNSITRFDAFVLPDSTLTTIAVGDFTFTGTSTEDGTLEFIVGSEINHKFIIEFVKGTIAASAGFEDTIVDAINADLTIPVVASATSPGNIQLDAANRGVEADKIHLEVTKTPPGISVTVAAMTGGANNPDTVDLFDAIQRQRYQTIIWPETYDQDTGTPTDSYKDLIVDLENRFSFDNEILDGEAIITFTRNFTDQKNQGLALDTQVLTIYANALVSGTLARGSAIPELNYVISSQFGAVRSLRFTLDADISQFVTATNGARDNFGGPASASLPYFNTPFRLLPVIREGVGFGNTEITELNEAGISVLSNNDPDTEIVSLEAVTLYKTNNAGQPDESFKFLNFVDTISGVREFFFNNLKARYAQSRLTEGDLVGGRSMANVNSIKAFIGVLYQDLAGPDFVLVQAGENAIKFFKDNLTVTIDLETGTVRIFARVPIVTQLREFIGDIQITFSVNG